MIQDWNWALYESLILDYCTVYGRVNKNESDRAIFMHTVSWWILHVTSIGHESQADWEHIRWLFAPFIAARTLWGTLDTIMWLTDMIHELQLGTNKCYNTANNKNVKH